MCADLLHLFTLSLSTLLGITQNEQQQLSTNSCTTTLVWYSNRGVDLQWGPAQATIWIGCPTTVSPPILHYM